MKTTTKEHKQEKPVINLGVIPVLVRNKQDAKRAGEYVEKMVRDILITAQ